MALINKCLHKQFSRWKQVTWNHSQLNRSAEHRNYWRNQFVERLMENHLKEKLTSKTRNTQSATHDALTFQLICFRYFTQYSWNVESCWFVSILTFNILTSVPLSFKIFQFAGFICHLFLRFSSTNYRVKKEQRKNPFNLRHVMVDKNSLIIKFCFLRW